MPGAFFGSLRGAGLDLSPDTRTVRKLRHVLSDVLRGAVVVVQHAAHAVAAADGTLGVCSPLRQNQFIADALMVPARRGSARRTPSSSAGGGAHRAQSRDSGTRGSIHVRRRKCGESSSPIMRARSWRPTCSWSFCPTLESNILRG